VASVSLSANTDARNSSNVSHPASVAKSLRTSISTTPLGKADFTASTKAGVDWVKVVLTTTLTFAGTEGFESDNGTETAKTGTVDEEMLLRVVIRSDDDKGWFDLSRSLTAALCFVHSAVEQRLPRRRDEWTSWRPKQWRRIAKHRWTRLSLRHRRQMQDGYFQGLGGEGIARQSQSLEARMLRVASVESASSFCCDELQEREMWILWPLGLFVLRTSEPSLPGAAHFISWLLTILPLAIVHRYGPIKHSFRSNHLCTAVDMKATRHTNWLQNL
jgi:hypothetical protein